MLAWHCHHTHHALRRIQHWDFSYQVSQDILKKMKSSCTVSFAIREMSDKTQSKGCSWTYLVFILLHFLITHQSVVPNFQ